MIPKDELQKLNERELEEELRKSQLDIYKLRLSVITRQSKETSKLKSLRKYIARVKTMQQLLKKISSS